MVSRTLLQIFARCDMVSGFGFWFLVSGFWFLVSGFWFLVLVSVLVVPGFWFLFLVLVLFCSGSKFKGITVQAPHYKPNRNRNQNQKPS